MSIFMVSANEAKKLRPSLMAAAVFIIGVVAVLVGQIGLNMVLTHDAYELRSLKLEKRDLATEVQIIQEEVSSLSSPQNLADAANRLGMVANPASVLLDIESNKIYGKPSPAKAEGQQVASANLVANSALGAISEFSLATVSSGEVQVSVETSNNSDTGLVLQSGFIPASPTR